MSKRILGVSVALAAVWFAGCASHTKTPSADAAKAVNSTCPLTDEALGAEFPTVTYQKTVIGFCCDRCVSKFGEMTAAEKDKVLAKAVAK